VNLLVDAEWSFMLMFSDGISSMVTDEEVRDIARNATNPKQAADKIVSYVEDLGGEDNLTAVVVPLLGWGKLQGSDPTKELREYKLQQTGGHLLSLFSYFCVEIDLHCNQLARNDTEECKILQAWTTEHLCTFSPYIFIQIITEDTRRIC